MKGENASRLCVISINCGRNFLHCSGKDSLLILRARLAGKIVSTEESSIAADGGVLINQELAWPDPTNSLVPRNYVRLDCYLAVSSSNFDHIGYFVIDIKQCKSTVRKIPKWHKLITSNMTFKKCEIEVTVYHEYKSINGSYKFTGLNIIEPESSGKLESIDDAIDQHIQYIKLDNNIEAQAALNIIPKLIEIPNQEIDIIGEMHLTIELDSKLWKYLLKSTRHHPNAYVLIGSGVYLLIQGSSVRIKQWMNTCLPNISLWVGSKLMGMGKINLSLCFDSQKSFHNKTKIPIKLSNIFKTSKITTVDLETDMIIGKLEILKPNIRLDPIITMDETAKKSEISSSNKSNCQWKNEKNMFNLNINCINVCLDSSIRDEFYIKYKYKLLDGNYHELNSGITRQINSTDRILKIPKSNCIIQFIADPNEIFDCLSKNLLIIELWTINDKVHICTGATSFDFRKILDLHGQKISKEDDKMTGLRKTIQQSQRISNCLSHDEYIAEIVFKIVLDIWDIKNPGRDFQSNCERSMGNNKAEKDSCFDIKQNFNKNRSLTVLNNQEPNINILESKIQAIHNELEWKNEIEKSLIASWKEKENQQKQQLTRKFNEYSELEAKLNLLVSEFEQKKKNIALQEIRMKNLKNQMNFEHEKKEFAMNEKYNKNIFEFKMKLAEKDNKIMELGEDKKRLQKSLKQSEVKYQDLEKKLEDHISKNNPEIIFRLRSEIDLLKTEKNFLSRELEIKSKNLDDIIKQNFHLDYSNKYAASDQKTEVESKNRINHSINVEKDKNESPYDKSNSEHEIDLDDREDGLVTSTRKGVILKSNSVENLVKEIDTQIQQVLVDLDK